MLFPHFLAFKMHIISESRKVGRKKMVRSSRWEKGFSSSSCYYSFNHFHLFSFPCSFNTSLSDLAHLSFQQQEKFYKASINK